MRRSKSRNSSVVFPSVNSFDFSPQRANVYTDKQAPMPLLITAPSSSCERNFGGTATRPFASIVCSYSPRNIFYPPAGDDCHFFSQLPHNTPLLPTQYTITMMLRKELYPPKSLQSGG